LHTSFEVYEVATYFDLLLWQCAYEEVCTGAIKPYNVHCVYLKATVKMSAKALI